MVLKDKSIKYPKNPPFNPSEKFPEYTIDSGLDRENRVYSLVREALHLLKLDDENFGSRDWNPFKNIISKGDTILIKPNFVTDLNRKVKGEEGQFALVTHGSVLRPIVDYAFKAGGKASKIIIADTPLEEPREMSFCRIAEFTGTKRMVEYLKLKKVPVELLDLRSSMPVFWYGFRKRKKLLGDPLGYREIDLKRNSEFYEIEHMYKQFETGDWINVSKYHNKNTNLYSISNTVLRADSIINVPKLKTHKKSGVTLSLKNVIGISDRKDWIPHWRRREDEYWKQDSITADFMKTLNGFPLGSLFILAANKIFKLKLKGQGNWQGNDTIWRAIIDLNKILFYANKEGKICSTKRRKHFSVVDGIIAGEGESPLAPTPRHFGAIIAGFDPVAVDTICCKLMRIDPQRVKVIKRSIDLEKYKYSDCSDLKDLKTIGDSVGESSEEFALPEGWDRLRSR